MRRTTTSTVALVAPSNATKASGDSEVFFATVAIGDDTLVVMPDFYQGIGLTYTDLAGVRSRAEL